MAQQLAFVAFRGPGFSSSTHTAPHKQGIQHPLLNARGTRSRRGPVVVPHTKS
ncbi:hypothetical protein I79_015050 [Cricetulus griseus]|uniref:Uncharacterized protein n=1 Tax=Cricetulus griseus TaxID=10029 RepID=G3HVQ9_CRIGR|nr:hypothetical protein I79_015050 [Cricetulus griseus]